jgi:hypothetical protein
VEPASVLQRDEEPAQGRQGGLDRLHVLVGQRGEGLFDQLGTAGPPAGQPAAGGVGQVESGSAAIGGVDLAVQPAGGDKLVDEGADRIVGEVEDFGGGTDADAGLSFDYAEQLDLGASERRVGHGRPEAAPYDAAHPGDDVH